MRLQIRQTGILIYDPTGAGQRDQEKQRSIITEAQKKSYSGAISPGAKKRLAKAVTILCQGIKPTWKYNPAIGKLQYHSISFCTLTIHSPNRNISAKEGYTNLLKPFLRWLREKHNVKSYIWKSELQQRGQLHYHLIFPALIHWKVIRDKWNQLQREAGYLDEYILKHGHQDANSTDIHQIYEKKNLAKYVVKELMKDIDARKLRRKKELIESGMDTETAEKKANEQIGKELKIDGKVWDCSNNISGLDYYYVPLCAKHLHRIDEIEKDPKTFKVQEPFFHYVDCSKSLDYPPWEIVLDPDEKLEFIKFVQYLFPEENDLEFPVFIPDEQSENKPDINTTYTFEQMELFTGKWSMGGRYEY